MAASDTPTGSGLALEQAFEGEGPDIEGMLSAVVSTRARVLLVGETGCGKTALAEELFRRAGGVVSDEKAPCHEVNLAAIPNGLAEAELFGVMGGRASGVDASDGWLFGKGMRLLDELHHASGSAAAMLLNVLEKNCFYRVGSRTPLPLEVWIVGATTRPERLFPEFRYRFGLMLRIKPLRDRPKDKEACIRAEAGKLSLTERWKYTGRPELITPAAHEWLMRERWPGNFRQLKAWILGAGLLASPEEGITVRDLEKYRAMVGPDSVWVFPGELLSLAIQQIGRPELLVEAALRALRRLGEDAGEQPAPRISGPAAAGQAILDLIAAEGWLSTSEEIIKVLAQGASADQIRALIVAVLNHADAGHLPEWKKLERWSGEVYRDRCGSLVEAAKKAGVTRDTLRGRLNDGA